MSIHPHWCELIFSGKKTLEIRKSFPKVAPPFRVLVYCTTAKTPNDNLWVTVPGGYNYVGNYHIIGEFICPKGTDMRDIGGEEFFRRSCMDFEDWKNYTDYTKHIIWGWEIEVPKLYPRPISLDDLGLKRPPQSWQYVSAPDDLFQQDSIFHRVGESCYNFESKGESK